MPPLTPDAVRAQRPEPLPTASRNAALVSKLGVARRARERDHIADIGHTGGVNDRPLEAEAEPGVRHGAVAPQVAVPAVLLFRQSQLIEPGVEHLQPLLAL